MLQLWKTHCHGSKGNMFTFYCFVLFEVMLEVTYYSPDVNGFTHVQEFTFYMLVGRK